MTAAVQTPTKTLNDAQRDWLKTMADVLSVQVRSETQLLGEVAGNGEPIALSARSLDSLTGSGDGGAAEDPPGFAGLGGQTVQAKGATGGKSFVPDLDIPSAPKLILAVDETVPLEFKIKNWNQLPKGTAHMWRTSVKGDKLKTDADFRDGEGIIKVTGKSLGESSVSAEIQIGSGDGPRYRFADTVFVVQPIATGPFVPDLDKPSAPKLVIAPGEAVTLDLFIRNWANAPTDTVALWGANATGKAVDITLEHYRGEGIVTVKGLAAGEATVSAEVKIAADKSGRSYRFANTLFKVDGQPLAPEPGSSPDEGGLATVTDLEQDMRLILQDWKGAAVDGISEFITSALNQRINDLASGSTKTFLIGLLGNVVWAGAAFTTGGAAFAISLAGIGLAAAPTVPQEVTDAFIPEIQKSMIDQIDKFYDQLNPHLRSNAKTLIKLEPGITRYHALAEFLRASFKRGFIVVNANYTTPPRLNKSNITHVYNAIATQQLEKALEADAKRKKEEEAAEERKKAEIRRVQQENHALRRHGEV